MIQAALQEDALEPVVAQRLTGKLNFLSTTLFGQAAQAAMKPLYARAHDRNDQEAARLNGPLRCSLRSLQCQQCFTLMLSLSWGIRALGCLMSHQNPGFLRVLDVTRTAGASWCGGARSFALRMGPFRPTCWDCSHPGAPSFTAWRFWDKLSLQ